MKKLVVTAISVLLVCGMGNYANANLLLNPSFESVTYGPVNFAYWNEGGTLFAPTDPPSANVVRTGIHSVGFDQTGGSVYQTFVLPTSGDTLEFGAYLRVQTFGLYSNWDQVQVSMQIIGDGTVVLGGGVSDLSSLLNDPNLWTETSPGNFWTPWILLSGSMDISGLGGKTAGMNINLQNYNTIRTNVFADDAFANVPEPSALLLLGSGLVGLVGYRRRKRMM